MWRLAAVLPCSHCWDASRASRIWWVAKRASCSKAAWEVIRGALQALALWWYEHRHVPRAQIVTIAMNVLWTGLERVRSGELSIPEA